MEDARKLSIADTIYLHLQRKIVSGEYAPGDALPSERALSDRLHANRGAVREALKCLQQSRLISIKRGGKTRVLDFRKTATLDLVSRLIRRPNGELDLGVARSMIELRTVISPDMTRLATLRGGPGLVDELRALLKQMRDPSADAGLVYDLVEEFWSTLANHSGNIAYVLILNTIREFAEASRPLLKRILSNQLTDISVFEAMADAIEVGDATKAENLARERPVGTRCWCDRRSCRRR